MDYFKQRERINFKFSSVDRNDLLEVMGFYFEKLHFLLSDFIFCDHNTEICTQLVLLSSVLLL